MDNIVPELKDIRDDITEYTFTTKLVGSTFQLMGQPVLQTIIDNHMGNLVNLRFECEPTNAYDSNAVKVMLSVEGYKGEYFVGYVPMDISEVVCYLLHREDLKVRVYGAFLYGGTNGYYVGMVYKFRFTKKDNN